MSLAPLVISGRFRPPARRSTRRPALRCRSPGPSSGAASYPWLKPETRSAEDQGEQAPEPAMPTTSQVTESASRCAPRAGRPRPAPRPARGRARRRAGAGEQRRQGKSEAEEGRSDRQGGGAGEVDRGVAPGRGRLARSLEHGRGVGRPVREAAGRLLGPRPARRQAEGQGGGQQQHGRGDLGGVHVGMGRGGLVRPGRPVPAARPPRPRNTTPVQRSRAAEVSPAATTKSRSARVAGHAGRLLHKDLAREGPERRHPGQRQRAGHQQRARPQQVPAPALGGARRRRAGGG